MTGRPVLRHSSIAACVSAYSGSGYCSRTGASSPSRGAIASTSALRHSMTWPRPRKRAMAAIGASLPWMRARSEDEDVSLVLVDTVAAVGVYDSHRVLSCDSRP